MTRARHDLELSARRRWVAGARLASERRRFFGGDTANGAAASPSYFGMTPAVSTPAPISAVPSTPSAALTGAVGGPAMPSGLSVGSVAPFQAATPASQPGAPMGWGASPWGTSGAGAPWNLAQLLGTGALNGLFSASSGMPPAPSYQVPPMTFYTPPAPVLPAPAPVYAGPAGRTYSNSALGPNGADLSGAPGSGGQGR
ncbi:MAG: hypothetical protein KGI63_13505 [Xanthomonadaceae bacterium]|nr:hypothetical protein [Xanthomonadaceae bacterium]